MIKLAIKNSLLNYIIKKKQTKLESTKYHTELNEERRKLRKTLNLCIFRDKFTTRDYLVMMMIIMRLTNFLITFLSSSVSTERSLYKEKKFRKIVCFL